MIKDNINKLILEAMKSKDKVKLESLRAIKTAIMNFETAKNAKLLDEAAEASLIKKLVDERLADAETFRKANRIDLAEIEEAQAEVIKGFLPAEVTAEQIEFVVENIVLSRVIEPVKKNLKAIINAVKQTYPTADGGLVFKIVSAHLE